MEHTEIRRQLSAYLDGEVSPAERAEIDAHLAACPRCRGALTDLERTIGHIRDLPRVEAPPWLTAKTMARVREVAEARPSLWQRLFFPLGVKLPLEAIAIVFLCITGYYLTRIMAPELTKVPSPAPSREEAAPLPGRPVVPEKPAEAPQQPTPVMREFAPPPPAAPTPPAPAPERKPALPASPAPAPAVPAAPLYNAPSRAMEDRVPGAPSAERAEAPMKKAKKAESAAPSAAGGIRTAPAASRYQAVLAVEDVAFAEEGAAEAVRRSGGTILRRDATESGTLLVVRVDAARLPDLLTRLERIGKLRQRPEGPAGPGAAVELTVRLEPNQ